ncbi:MAG: EF-P lysine aminoacylase EpmA [Pirellulales bacterium]
MDDQRENLSFAPTATWAVLRRRAELLERLRAFFRKQRFLEVETPLLAFGVVVDRYLEPFCVCGPSDEKDASRQPPRRWLQTSPEAAMKRLMAAGAEAIYQVTRSFRQGESGRLHNPEFTIVEWYRRGDSMAEAIERLSDLCQVMLDTEPAQRIRYRDAFLEHVGIDPLTAETGALAERATQFGMAATSGPPVERDRLLEFLMVERVEPNLGRPTPAILYDYPASQAALARVRPENPPVAERFELYVEGIELANGYHELTDAAEWEARREAINRARIADGKTALPPDPYFEAAMRHGLPPCSGVALGFDRLVMLAIGANCIADVMTFPFDRV